MGVSVLSLSCIWSLCTWGALSRMYLSFGVSLFCVCSVFVFVFVFVPQELCSQYCGHKSCAHNIVL